MKMDIFRGIENVPDATLIGGMQVAQSYHILLRHAYPSSLVGVPLPKRKRETSGVLAAAARVTAAVGAGPRAHCLGWFAYIVRARRPRTTSATVAIGDGQTAVAAKRPLGDLHAGRRLTPLVFSALHHLHHALHRHRIVAHVHNR